MDTPDSNCDACGAPGEGLICEHCGKPTAHLVNAADENRALDEYHNLLRQLAPDDQRNWLLTSGFIPDHKEVLIEAGIYCLPLLKSMSIYDAAASRLETIITKLKLLHGDEQARRAIEDFQAGIESYKTQKRKDNFSSAGCLLTILAAITAVGYWLVWEFGLSIAVPIIAVIVVVTTWLIVKK
jgi:hypothetical protein